LRISRSRRSTVARAQPSCPAISTRQGSARCRSPAPDPLPLCQAPRAWRPARRPGNAIAAGAGRGRSGRRERGCEGRRRRERQEGRRERRPGLAGRRRSEPGRRIFLAGNTRLPVRAPSHFGGFLSKRRTVFVPSAVTQPRVICVLL
jgi:hypothetical protein